MARGWKREPGRHGLAAKGVKTGRKKKPTRETLRLRQKAERQMAEQKQRTIEHEVRRIQRMESRGNPEPLKFVEPVNKLHRLAKKYQPGITKEKVVFMAKRNPASFFMDLTEEMPLNAQTRKDSDKMAKLALEIDLGREVN